MGIKEISIKTDIQIKEQLKVKLGTSYMENNLSKAHRLPLKCQLKWKNIKYRQIKTKIDEFLQKRSLKDIKGKSIRMDSQIYQQRTERPFMLTWRV